MPLKKNFKKLFHKEIEKGLQKKLSMIKLRHENARSVIIYKINPKNKMDFNNEADFTEEEDADVPEKPFDDDADAL